MSDGLNRVLGTDTELEIKGTKYRATRLRYKHIAEAAQHVVDQRPNLITEVSRQLKGQDMDPEMRRDILDAAMRRMDERKQPTEPEMRQFMGSPEGQLFILWQMLRENNKEFDAYDKVLEAFLNNIDLEELGREINAKAGLDDLKNSAGRATEDGSPATTADPHEQRGQSSICG